jgi:hypothetical protein
MQAPDTKPGAYFVSVQDGDRFAAALGPFVDDHAAALAQIEAVRALAQRLQPRAAFYAFGTCRLDHDHPQAQRPGTLNDYFPALALPSRAAWVQQQGAAA